MLSCKCLTYCNVGKDKVKLKKVKNRPLRNHIKTILNTRFGFYSVFFEDLAIHRPGVRFYHALFVIRRLMFMVFVLMVSYAWIQVHSFIISCIIRMSFILHAKPFINDSSIYTEIINELFLITIGYQMVLLTGYVIQPTQKLEIGKILLRLVWTMLIYNGLCIAWGIIKSI